MKRYDEMPFDGQDGALPEQYMNDMLPEGFGIEDEQLSEEQIALREEMRRLESVRMFGLRLQHLAETNAAKRSDIEKRWLDDIRHYNGMYDEETQAKLDAVKGGSKLFVNITRPKVSIGESRLADMLFPTDEKNWGIKPTPVPELSEEMEKLKGVAPSQPIGMTEEGAQVQAQDLVGSIKQIMAEADKRAAAMEAEINDQLTEAQYTIKARDAIHEAIVVGTGVLKAPCIIGRSKRTWETRPDGSYAVAFKDDLSPTVEQVSHWDFYPDMSATKLSDAEFIFQRHRLTRKQLANLRRTTGFDADAIEDLLNTRPTNSAAKGSIDEVRQLGTFHNADDKRYEVWEYHGSVDVSDMTDILGEEISQIEAAELEAIVFICQGKVLKAIINPMDTEDRPYSVFNWEKDSTSIFGYGIPFLLRTPQKSINGTYRMTMDNGGLATAPQIVVNSGAVRPVDGNWAMTPRKVWELTDRARNVQDVFATFDTNSHLNELLALYNQAREMADELIALPLIMQGQEAPHLTQTAKGMSILMNSANTVMRRAVTNWDDDVTKPLIQRFYDWNMQFNPKQEIKGDLSIVARGTSALLERESQSERLMLLLNMAGAFGGLIKVPQLARKLVQAMNLPAEELVLTDEELEQQAQNQPQQPDPMMARIELDKQKIQAQIQNDQMDFQTEQARFQMQAQKMQADLMAAEKKMQMELQKMAYEQGLSVEQIKAQLGIKQMQIESDERKLAAELNIKTRMGSGI